MRDVTPSRALAQLAQSEARAEAELQVYLMTSSGRRAMDRERLRVRAEARRARLGTHSYSQSLITLAEREEITNGRRPRAAQRLISKLEAQKAAFYAPQKSDAMEGFTCEVHLPVAQLHREAAARLGRRGARRPARVLDRAVVLLRLVERRVLGRHSKFFS